MNKYAEQLEQRCDELQERLAESEKECEAWKPWWVTVTTASWYFRSIVVLGNVDFHAQRKVYKASVMTLEGCQEWETLEDAKNWVETQVKFLMRNENRNDKYEW